MRRRWIIGAVMAIVLILGAVMWMTQEERTQRAMMNYLEDKYGEKFEMEFFDKGDMFFPDLYGDDKMMAYPVSNPDIPFYVFKDRDEPSGFYDLYVPSYFSYKYTQKYKRDILDMDTRELGVKFVLSSADRPVEAEVMERSVDDVARDDKYGYHIRLYLAIKTDGDLNIQEESELLFNLYTYMEQKRNKDKDVVLAVAYIRSDKFADSEQLLRRSHALNFDWDMMEQGAVIYQIYFGSGNDIQGPEYFSKFFK